MFTEFSDRQAETRKAGLFRSMGVWTRNRDRAVFLKVGTGYAHLFVDGTTSIKGLVLVALPKSIIEELRASRLGTLHAATGPGLRLLTDREVVSLQGRSSVL